MFVCCGLLVYTVFQMYSKYSKVDVSKALDLELKGDIENCLTAVGKISARREELD